MSLHVLPLALRSYQGIASRARNRMYQALGVELQGYVWMRAIEIPRNWQDIVLEGEVSLDRGVTLLCSGPHRQGKLLIRSGTYVNRYTMFDAHAGMEIGRNCMIGPHCYLTDSDHGVAAGPAVKSQSMRSVPVILEDEVWLGAHVVVLRGVRLGRGAVVGAGSVVTTDIPGRAVAVGVPARVVKMRD
jgi:acetyltransferase-like isoleucine patch superfamily enzyme